MEDKGNHRSRKHTPAASSAVTSLRSAAKEFESAREAVVGIEGEKDSSLGGIKVGTLWLRVLWNLSVGIAVGIYIARFSRYHSSATLFPRLVGYPVLILALVSLVLDVAQLVRRRLNVLSQPGREQISLLNLFIGMALAALYFALWNLLGFELDTVVLIILAPIILGYSKRRIIVLVAIGFLIAALFTFLFGLGSGAILPLGYFNIRWP